MQILGRMVGLCYANTMARTNIYTVNAAFARMKGEWLGLVGNGMFHILIRIMPCEKAIRYAVNITIVERKRRNSSKQS